MIEQRSDAHAELRAGKITGSVVARLMNGTVAGWASLARELQNPKPFFENTSVPALNWGITNEPFAIAAYELLTGTDVERVAYLPHPIFTLSGASPDGIIQPNGGIEVKCPYDRNKHFSVIYSNKIPQEHLPQMHLNIRCADAEWWDFVSFDPRSVGNMRLAVIRLHRDDEYLRWMDERIQQFIEFEAAGETPDPKINTGDILRRLKF